MLKHHAKFLKSLLFFCDLILICGCWIGAYYLRRSGIFYPAPQNFPPVAPYLWLLPLIVLIWAISFQAFNLYRPRRMGSHSEEFFDIAKANTLSVLVLISLTFFLKQFEYSRLIILYFWFFNLLTLGFSRMVFREFLRWLRRLGYNQRHALIIGAGELGQKMARSLRNHPEMGFIVRGYLTRHASKKGKVFEDSPVVGGYDDVKEVVSSGIDVVFLCLPPDEEHRVEKLMKDLGQTVVEIKVIPAVYEFTTLRADAEMFDGIPLITLQGSPLYGWNRVLKRGIDVVGASIALVVASPLMFIIAIVIKMASPGPVLYRQIRVGMDVQAFHMLKFRTMKVDAEKETGPVWASPRDPRRTWIGTFLRRTSLDELPQFWNVLKGEMSIVGPRPERPEFVEPFRKKIPQYILRYKMKAGITGWAQVNGLRGNTSWEKRLNYDIYYIENWSIWLDIKIMVATIWKGFSDEHAY